MAGLVTVAVALGLIVAWQRSQGSLPSIRAVRAFPNLKIPLPVVLTHAGDGTNRVFVGSQRGLVHVFAHDETVTETQIFLDIESQVTCHGEEGLLGLAFHPNYRRNGEFFVYYSQAGDSHASIISRFRVSDDDPNRADEQSEEVLLRIDQPLADHNGGTLVFGPDGYLYIGLGDGGAIAFLPSRASISVATT